MKRSLLEIFEDIPEPRKGNGIRHKLIDIITIGVLATLCDCTGYTEMALFAELRFEWLKTFLELPHGAPSHDTFGDVFSAIEPEAVHRCFREWIETIREKISNEVIAIDGKTVRRSKDDQNGKKPLHVVSAWANENRLVLGEIATEEKSNEITAIPALLRLLDVKGCIVTIDAMGTQKDIARTIKELGGEYLLALKDNQRTLCEDVEYYLENEVLTQPKEQLREEERYYSTCEKSHGRIEKRECFVTNDVAWIDGIENWAGLSGIGMIRVNRQVIGKPGSEETVHYFIYSKADMTASEALHVKRSHWGIENSLHWVLDMVFHEDESRARTNHGAENLNILRHLALSLVKSDTSVKDSMKSKLKRCVLSNDYLLHVIGVDSIS